MREGRVIEALAVIIGLAGEGLLVWLLNSLPLWVQLCLYVPVGLAILAGLVILFRQGRQARRGLAGRDRPPGTTKPARPPRSRAKPPPPPRERRE